MTQRLARATALLTMVFCAWFAPHRALAQILPPLPLPGGSLIVTVTSPASGSTVSGTVPVSASVSIAGTLTVSGVQFRLDGANLGAQDTSAPYSVSWNTTTASNGSHTLTAVARDVLGVQWTSNPVTVTVFNGPPPDTTPPTVSITSPASGAIVGGTINVTASASDNVGVVGVRFFLDGALGADDTSAPYSVPWNTTGAANGSQHTLTAVARDAAGNTRTSAPVTVTVSNNTARPTVTINQAATQADPASASPINFTAVFSEAVSGFTGADVTISGTAGGTKTVTVTGGPSTYNVAVSGMTSSGTLIATLGAGVAQDAAGNNNTASTSTDNSVTFNLPDTAPPTVSMTSPAPGAVVSGMLTVTANASDNNGVAGVQFKFNNNNFGAEVTVSPYAVTGDTTTIPNGTYTLTAVARDVAGNSTTSAGVTVTVSNGGAGVTRVEESNSTVIFSNNSTTGASQWVPRGPEVAAFSGGTASSSDVTGATVTFTFTGTAVSWIGLKCSVCGIATVSIDGGASATVDTAAPGVPGSGLTSEVVFSATGLASGVSHTMVITVAGAGTSSGAHIVVDAFDVAGSSTSPIAVENLQPGSGNWQMWRPGFRVADDVNQQIKGYGSATSVNKGESITFYVTLNPAQEYTMDVYRMGWYQGLGGRLLQHIGPLPGVEQPACPVDTVTGLIECDWTASYTLTVPTTWTSGVYLVQLTNAQGYQNYITFVVRDDARRADIRYQQPVATYQAYNNYPDDGATGKSIYDFNSHGAITVTGGRRAAKVSWNRPYRGDGGGDFLFWEYYFVRWLERSGYDVKYLTDLDTHQNSAQLLDSKVFLSVGHDEYWSKPMYDGVERARDAGVSLGFFSANQVFWQVRFEASPVSGVADRVMVGYKERSLDPVQGPTTTINWRDPFLNRPEQGLIGVQYTGERPDNVPNAPYVVTNSSSWVYEGTGLVDGEGIPGIVGYEADASMANVPLPTSVAGTYEVLSQSPFADVSGRTMIANSSIYQAPSGAWVFGAGTISWSWGLDRLGVVDSRIQRITANLLNRFLRVSVQP